jgi:hypothetical protein
MFLVRDIMYCKPGQARPMVNKFLALSAISQQLGMGPTRVMTDVSAERYWDRDLGDGGPQSGCPE